MTDVGSKRSWRHLRDAIGRLPFYASFWLKAFAQSAIDLSLRTHPGHVTRIVESPGRSLPQGELDRLVAQLRTVAAKTLPANELTYGIFSGERERLSRAIVTLISEEDSGRPVAFNALSVMQVARRRARRRHPSRARDGRSGCARAGAVLGAVWLDHAGAVPARWPAPALDLQRNSSVYPSPRPEARQSFAHLQLARGIMRQHRSVFGVGDEAAFDESRFVITDAYTGGSDALKKSFDEAPKHRDPQYAEFCARELNYARGDDILQIGRVDLAAARAYLFEQVPARSLPGLFVASLFLGLQRLVLPLMHWLDDDRTFGTLRPRQERGR